MPYKDPEIAKQKAHEYYLKNKKKIIENTNLRRLGDPALRKKEYDSFKERCLSDSELANKERIRNKKYREEHKEQAKKYRNEHKQKNSEYKRKYQQKNKQKNLEKHQNRLETDINYRIACNLRSRLSIASRNSQKSGSAIRDLGCSMPFFVAYIESLWQPGMTWENYGRYGWHFDHKIPLCFFNLSDPEQVKLACNYKNIQPLWAKENWQKNKKLDWKKE